MGTVHPGQAVNAKKEAIPPASVQIPSPWEHAELFFINKDGNGIPKDVVSDILAFLSLTDLGHMLLVCKELCKFVLQQNEIWKYKYLERWGLPSNSKEVSLDWKLNIRQKKIELKNKELQELRRCKNCGLYFTEAKNEAQSCKYHSGKFVTNMASSRFSGIEWSCCKSQKRDAIGCIRKKHLEMKTKKSVFIE